MEPKIIANKFAVRLVFRLLLCTFVLWAVGYFGAKIALETVVVLLKNRLAVSTQLDFLAFDGRDFTLGLKDFAFHNPENNLSLQANKLRLTVALQDLLERQQKAINLVGSNILITLPQELSSPEKLLPFLQKMLLTENVYLKNCHFSNCQIAAPHLIQNSPLNWPFETALKTAFAADLGWHKQFSLLAGKPGSNRQYALQLQHASRGSAAQSFGLLNLEVNAIADGAVTTLCHGKGIVQPQNSFLELFVAQQPLGSIKQLPTGLCANIDLGKAYSALGQTAAPEQALNLKFQLDVAATLPGAKFVLAGQKERPPYLWGHANLAADFKQLEMFWHGNQQFGNIHGAVKASLDSGQILSYLATDAAVQLPGFKITPGLVKLMCQVRDEIPKVHFQYQFKELHPRIANGFGNVELGNYQHPKINLMLPNQLNLSACCDFKTALKLKHFSCKRGNATIMQTKMSENGQAIQGLVDSAAFGRQLLPKKIAKHLNGSLGKVLFSITTPAANSVQINATNQGVDGLLLADFINPLKKISFQANVDLQERSITLPQINLGFAHGRVKVAAVKMDCNNLWRPQALQATITANDFLCNRSQLFFTLINSKLALDWRQGVYPKLTGQITLLQSSYNKNFVAIEEEPLPPFIENYLNPTTLPQLLALDLDICSAQPMAVHTLGINGKINLNLKFKGFVNAGLELLQPELDGEVNFTDGKLKILGNELAIKHGRCKFIPSLGTSPFVDILACGKIKKYNLSMHVFGGLSKPNVHFRSNPEMSEEQIASFLLSGFGDNQKSLMQFFPGIIIKSLEEEIFKSNKTISKLSQVIKNITNPAHGLMIAPCLIDSKIDNLGAAVSFNLGPRLHALARKGLHVKDHLSLQMEYLLSQNLSLKVGRASQGNIEGELELKFKF